MTLLIRPGGAMKAEPASIVVSADGGDYVKDLRWSGWGSGTAVGSGNGEQAYATMRLSAPGNSYNETFSQGLVP